MNVRSVLKIALIFLLVTPVWALAQTSGGQVPPGGSCTGTNENNNCEDIGSNIYGCYQGTCTLDGDPVTAGTAQPGDPCTNDASCADGTNGQIYSCTAPTYTCTLDSYETGIMQSPTTATNNTTQTSSGVLTNPLNAPNLQTLISEILQEVVLLGTIFLTLMIIYTGFKFVTARGNDEKIREARTALLWTVVGGLLLLGASVIAQAIAATIQSL